MPRQAQGDVRPRSGKARPFARLLALIRGLLTLGARRRIASRRRPRLGYRPERHYLRGPGPAWHARQAQPDE